MSIEPVLDCRDPYPPGHQSRNPYLTRVIHEGSVIGWFKHLVGRGEDGADQWRVAVCYEGRIHLGGIADDPDIASKLMIIQIAGLHRETQNEGQEQ